MKRCPACKATSSRFGYSAWTVKTSGYVTFDSRGRVEDLLGSVASVVVKAGQELTTREATLTCELCGHTGRAKDFRTVQLSWLSGTATQSDVEVPFSIALSTDPSAPRWAGRVTVDQSELDETVKLFSEHGILRVFDSFNTIQDQWSTLCAD